MSVPDRLRWIRLVALSLGALLFPLTVLFAVAGAGFYGSPFSEVTLEGLPIVVAYFVLGGPLNLLPLAILSFWLPRIAGALILAGGACAVMLAIHPWGIQYAAPHLYTDIGPVFAPVALVTLVIGLTMVVVDGTNRRLVEAVTVGGLALFLTYTSLDRVQTREVFAPFRTMHPISALAFGPDGRTIIAVWRRPRIEPAVQASLSLVDVDTGSVRIIGEYTSEFAAARDGAWFVTVSPNGAAFWDAKSFRVREQWGDAAGPVAISPGGYAALAQRGGLQLLHPSRRGPQRNVRYDSGSRWLAWSPDDSLLAIGPGTGGDILLLDPRTLDLSAFSIAGDEDRAAGQFAPDARTLAVLLAKEQGARILLVSTPEGREIRSLAASASADSEWFSPDGRTMVTWRLDESTTPRRPVLTFWDTATWQPRAAFPAALPYAWSPDGTAIVTIEPTAGSDQRIVLRSAADGSRLRELGAITMAPTAVAFSPDGAHLAVGGDGEVVQGSTRGDIVIFATR